MTQLVPQPVADPAAAGRRSRAGDETARSARWIRSHQRDDGEPQFTGTGFAGDFSINYHPYRLVFPISALGRLLRTTGELW
jgi:squalene-hopene/tetraprenyl-beta-curcumene cyclase